MIRVLVDQSLVASSHLARSVVALSLLLGATAMAGAQSNPGGNRIVCPLLFAPVCGQKGDETKTFANRCMAERSGYVVIRSGSCDGTPRSQMKLLP